MTGGNGQVGRAFAALASGAGQGSPTAGLIDGDESVGDGPGVAKSPSGPSRKKAAPPASLFSNLVVAGRKDLDITQESEIADALERTEPSVIVNAAAFTAVDAAEGDPQTAHAINGDAVEMLARAADSVGALLVQISTDYVFAGDKPGPYVETDPIGPLSVYGKTKLAGEIAARGAANHLIVRTSWVYGDGQNFVRSILKAAKDREELSVVDDQIGIPTFAPHLAEGILALVEKGAEGLYHLAATGDAGAWADVAETAARAAGLPTRIRRITTEEYFANHRGPVAPRPANSVLNCAKAAAIGVVLPEWRRAVGSYAAPS